jgi:hypothetical protein
LKLKAAASFTSRPYTLAEIVKCLEKERTDSDIRFMKEYFKNFMFMEDIIKGEDTH